MRLRFAGSSSGSDNARFVTPSLSSSCASEASASTSSYSNSTCSNSTSSSSSTSSSLESSTSSSVRRADGSQTFAKIGPWNLTCDVPSDGSSQRTFPISPHTAVKRSSHLSAACASIAGLSSLSAATRTVRMAFWPTIPCACAIASISGLRSANSSNCSRDMFCGSGSTSKLSNHDLNQSVLSLLPSARALEGPPSKSVSSALMLSKELSSVPSSSSPSTSSASLSFAPFAGRCLTSSRRSFLAASYRFSTAASNDMPALSAIAA
mmetsp:Transcript_100046/g.188318  ORF Transcript_100046/g.188318 Transcript_100046/m.188318 type:complete len:265 (+) Transcript_100046:570-1364(+)